MMMMMIVVECRSLTGDLTCPAIDVGLQLTGD